MEKFITNESLVSGTFTEYNVSAELNLITTILDLYGESKWTDAFDIMNDEKYKKALADYNRSRDKQRIEIVGCLRKVIDEVQFSLERDLPISNFNFEIMEICSEIMANLGSE